jgi:hypothetical protein
VQSTGLTLKSIPLEIKALQKADRAFSGFSGFLLHKPAE